MLVSVGSSVSEGLSVSVFCVSLVTEFVSLISESLSSVSSISSSVALISFDSSSMDSSSSEFLSLASLLGSSSSSVVPSSFVTSSFDSLLVTELLDSSVEAVSLDVSSREKPRSTSTQAIRFISIENTSIRSRVLFISFIKILRIRLYSFIFSKEAQYSAIISDSENFSRCPQMSWYASCPFPARRMISPCCDIESACSIAFFLSAIAT